MTYKPTKENLPYPTEVIKLLMDLHRSERLSKDEVEMINQIIFCYLDIRAFYLYDE